MSYLTQITAGIGALDRWQRVAIATMCAQSVLPVITRFAQPSSRQAFKQGLDSAWRSAEQKALDSRALETRATLSDLPESKCDDSNMPAYEVMIALSVLAYTLYAMIEDNSAHWVVDACTAAADHYSGYDTVLASGNRPRRIDPRNPPPPGRFQTLQIQAQIRSIEIMQNIGGTNSEAIEQVHALAVQLSSESEGILGAVAEKRGWT